MSFGHCTGTSQFIALTRLSGLGAGEPPWGVDVRSGHNEEVSHGFDSPTERLWEMLVEDRVR
ncbi:MAG: hypothetical protein ACRERU_22665 [Methylococcales bacterium]